MCIEQQQRNQFKWYQRILMTAINVDSSMIIFRRLNSKSSISPINIVHAPTTVTNSAKRNLTALKVNNPWRVTHFTLRHFNQTKSTKTFHSTFIEVFKCRASLKKKSFKYQTISIAFWLFCFFNAEILSSICPSRITKDFATAIEKLANDNKTKKIKASQMIRTLNGECGFSLQNNFHEKCTQNKIGEVRHNFLV